MIVAAHQINFLPWIGYFVKMNFADQFILAENLQFTKHGYSNRVKIKSVSGEQWLTIPVLTTGKGLQQLKEVKIDNTRNWKQKHWKSLLVNYKNAEYFSMYSETIHKAYHSQWKYLIDFNLHFIEYICNELNIKTVKTRSSKIILDESSSATQQIINMVKFVKGDKYISGQSGKNYLKEKMFENNKIELKYFSFEHPHYQQQFEQFIPNLSIIDLLFNEGPNAEQLLNNLNKITESYQSKNEGL